MKEEKNENKEKKEIIFTSFNQNCKCFLVGTKEGITVYHSLQYKKGFELGNSNILFN